MSSCWSGSGKQPFCVRWGDCVVVVDGGGFTVHVNFYFIGLSD